MKSVAIVQSNYIPWKGYFDLINSVDHFILLDDVQYTVRDWRNRNRLKTTSGLQWLTIPVNAKGIRSQLIKDVTISDPNWADLHFQTISQNYSRADHFPAYRGWLRNLYLGHVDSRLSAVNRRFIAAICHELGITTPITASSDYQVVSGKNERLISLCEQVGADVYLSGPSAKGYLDVDLFRSHGISVSFMDYSGYAEYAQLYPPFEHQVTCLDLILNEGPGARRYLKTPVSA